MQLKSKDYWTRIINTSTNHSLRTFALKVLDTIFSKQNGVATPRQLEVLKRIERGDTSNYPTKN